MTTQLQRYRGLLAALGSQKEREALEGAQLCLQHLCGTAQNPPPDGLADGSIGDQTFEQLRDLQQSLGRYLRYLNIALEATKGSP